MEPNYFTKLFSIGNWRLRQFVNPRLVIGSNRVDIIGDKLNINEENGLAGFNSALYGTSKMVLSLQTQTYSPHSVLGFRLNPFFNYSIAVLGSPDNAMLRSKSYYPTIPYQGDNVFKTNTFETTDYGLQSFELAKPRIVDYK
jgi:hypothetical protein